MKFDIKKVRTEQYNMSLRKFAGYCGIGPAYYKKHEEAGDIPSKYIYTLWRRLPNFPLPHDFFFFTSWSLQLNMNLHSMTQTQIAEMFGFRTQALVSKYMSENIPMYEMKEIFLKFKPFYAPVEYKQASEGFRLLPIYELTPKGMLQNSYLETAKKRGRVKKAHDDLKRIQKENESKE